MAALRVLLPSNYLLLCLTQSESPTSCVHTSRYTYHGSIKVLPMTMRTDPTATHSMQIAERCFAAAAADDDERFTVYLGPGKDPSK